MCGDSPVVMTRSSILPSMQFETALNRNAFPEREWKLYRATRPNQRSTVVRAARQGVNSPSMQNLP